MAAWLRLGKLAVFSILAGLAVAVGMALPDGEAAEAQGTLAGYSYTSKYCQELGRQPRFYNVRNPIPGSDWRNDGGWAIVMIRSTNSRTHTHYVFEENQIQQPPSNVIFESAQHGVEKTSITDRGGELTGFLRLKSDGTPFDASLTGVGVRNYDGWVVIDRNKDGEIDSQDEVTTLYGQRYTLYRYYIVNENENYGATYVRWANMLWCR